MSFIQRQGFFNSISLYLGTAIGFLNLMIVFQRTLTLEEIGFYNILVAITILYTQFASLGISNVITRYLPQFRTRDHRHHGFARYIFLTCSATFILFSASFFLFKDEVISFRSDDAGASLMDQFYPYFLPIAICSTFYLIQESFARTAFKTIIPSFLREVVLRLFSTLGAGLIFLDLVGYRGFINLYLIGHISITLLISFYVFRSKIYNLAPIEEPVRKEVVHMLRFGFYSMLGGSSFALLQNIDLIVLKILSGEALVGIYSTFFAMAQVITLSSRALNITSYQIIANAWKEQNLETIHKIYKKTTIVQCFAGALLLIGLICNRDNLLVLLKKPEYPAYFNVLVVVGIAFLVDATGGINQAIIGFSKHYRLVMVFLCIAAVVCGLLNIALIPEFGLLGAAYSYLLTMLLTNFSFWLFLRIRYRMQPFSWKVMWIIFICFICLAVNRLVPTMPHFLIDIPVRSLLIGALFTTLCYLLHVSEDINRVIDQYVLRKAR